MGTEQFTKVVPVNGMAEGVVHTHALRGDPVTGVGLVNNPGLREGIAPAGLFSTAPYVDPSIARKEKLVALQKAEDARLAHEEERKGRCWAKGGTCKGWAQEKYGLCGGHTQAFEKNGQVS